MKGGQLLVTVWGNSTQGNWAAPRDDGFSGTITKSTKYEDIHTFDVLRENSLPKIFSCLGSESSLET